MSSPKLCLKNEEEKLYVMDLLGKKIIQPSSSEWAAAPVICMKDGKIPYCMDYLFFFYFI
jgi:hypothetical protein